MIALVVVWGMLLARAILQYGNLTLMDTAQSARLVTAVIMSALYCLVVGYVVFRIGKRSQTAGTCGFVFLAILLMLLHLSAYSKEKEGRQNADVIRGLLESGNQASESIRESIESGGYSAYSSSNEYALQAQNFREAAEQSTGEVSVIYTAFAEQFDAMAPFEEAYDRTLRELDETGLWTVREISEREHVDVRIEKARAFREANAAMLAAQRSYTADFQNRLLSKGISEQDARRSAATVRVVQDIKVRQHEIDQEYAELLIEIFEFYLEYWDDWGYDPDEDNIVIPKDEPFQLYDAYVERLNDIAQRTQAAIDELFRTQERLRASAAQQVGG